MRTKPKARFRKKYTMVSHLTYHPTIGWISSIFDGFHLPWQISFACGEFHCASVSRARGTACGGRSHLPHGEFHCASASLALTLLAASIYAIILTLAFFDIYKLFTIILSLFTFKGWKSVHYAQKASFGIVKKVEVSLLPLIYQNIYGIIIAVKWSDCGLRWFYRCLSFGRSFRGALR